ncbi:hypothetical protein SAMN05216377_11274 [Pseudonocardia oroxyli]|uniref:Uncharacterized protein n=1 Tax=Pseudonocardia oroxyli TaxID=366584 RepID=A0A1G7UMM8_PSEOR|nr:hypothetical protein SAMN05216377_11274 [Pseudonocardia oroxyli]
MTTPKPSATFGAWRYESLKMAGRVIIPAHFNEYDRRSIDKRTVNDHDTKAHHDSDDA